MAFLGKSRSDKYFRGPMVHTMVMSWTSHCRMYIDFSGIGYECGLKQLFSVLLS